MPNRLASSTSPYLLQHQNNPVDWYPWGKEALTKAIAEDKPIFLSVGYSACHWCHVMEHESFENPQIADILNEHFVSIKVDREQRPDLDQIYMQVLQWMTGSGGWPMSVFLTPQTEPFYAGTYWPPTDSMGRPGFDSVLKAVLDAWKNKRVDLTNQADQIVKQLNLSVVENAAAKASVGRTFDADTAREILAAADQMLNEVYDAEFGGFGNAPKFPHATDLALLLRFEQRMPSSAREQIVKNSLDRMADGGIFDHLGGGFARYSVDRHWLVPHFEKMLYDNALLAGLYVDAFRWSKSERYKEVATATLDYILRDMTDSSGGFYSAQDADSEGVEGKYYVWSQNEIDQLLSPEDAKVFALCFDVSADGNFEGKNILHLAKPFQTLTQELGLDLKSLREILDRSKKTLLAHRYKRVAPGKDDKILVAWNALLIEALCRASVAFDKPEYLQAARRCADFIESEMLDSNGDLLHVWRQGKAEIGAFLDDYAALCNGLISLWECSGDYGYLQRAVDFARKLCEKFAAEAGGFYFTSIDAEKLIARTLDHFDGSTPSGNALAATALTRLWWWTGNEDFRRSAEGVFGALAKRLQENPGAGNQTAIAMDHWLGPVSQWTVNSNSSEQLDLLRRSFFDEYRSNMILAAIGPQSSERRAELHPVFEHEGSSSDGECVLYVCEGFTCQRPIQGLDEIEQFIASNTRPRTTKL